MFLVCYTMFPQSIFHCLLNEKPAAYFNCNSLTDHYIYAIYIFKRIIKTYCFACIKQAEGESPAENCEKPGSLGKKMKAISMTMRKRMAKKHVKSYSEDMVSHNARSSFDY